MAGLCCLIRPALAGQAEGPFFDGRTSLHHYNGPGRDDIDPPGLTEIRIGYFGPSDPDHPLYGDSWTAAQMAIDDLNARGGYRGLPFRLLPAWSENPWGSGVGQIARMVYNDGIQAIIGGVDGPTAHLAEQIVAKARLPLLNPGSTDRSANMAHVPWIFSCLPGDDLQMELLLETLEKNGHTDTIVLISATDHDSRAVTTEFLEALSKRESALHYHLNVTTGDETELSNLNRQLLAGSVRPTLVILADPQVSAQVARHLAPIYSGPVYGSSAMGRRSFHEAAAGLSNRFIFPLPADLGALEEFSKRFRSETGHPADFAAAQTYDAIELLGEAVREAGANRARIGDTLRAKFSWSGAAGPIVWDLTGQNTRPVTMVEMESGQISPWKP